jgi:hypothetical protein
MTSFGTVTKCEEGELYTIIQNNKSSQEYYKKGLIIRIIKVNPHARSVFNFSGYTLIQPESYRAIPAQMFTDSIASFGFLKSDLEKGIVKLNPYQPKQPPEELCRKYEEDEGNGSGGSSKRYRCTSPAAGGKKTKKTIKRRRKGRKRRGTKRNKRQ